MRHDRYISRSRPGTQVRRCNIFSQTTTSSAPGGAMDCTGKGGAGRGLDITNEQIAELEKHRDDINYDVATAREKEVRHDVMSHVYAYGQHARRPRGFPPGATSCYVGDNTDVL